MIQSWGLLDRLFGLLLRTVLPLIENVIKPLAKSILIPLGLTAAASAANSGIYKTILGSGHNNNNTTTLMILKNKMEHIIKIVRPLQDSVYYQHGLLKQFKMK